MIMSQTICFSVVCLENVLLRHVFLGPTPTIRQGGRFWHEMSTLVPRRDLSYNAVGPIFRIFIHNGSMKKTAIFQLCIKFRSNLACGSKWRKVQFVQLLCSLINLPAFNWSLTGPIFMNFSH